MILTKRFSTSKKGYGGNIYETMVDRALEKTFDHEVISNPTRFHGALRLFEAPVLLLRWFQFAARTDSFLIRSYQTAFFDYKANGLTIVHHIDATHSRALAWFYQKLLETIFFHRHRVDEPIVVVAQYWKNFLADRGYRNLHLIYQGYSLQEYDISDAEIEKFRRRYDLDGKKIIYIGNPQRKKGADLCYEALKNSEYTLVTSGVRELQLPCLHLDLSFRDYLCLLRSSEVVLTMSQFREGWNRVAHEAMLVGTPVVGSGMGGMRELLLGGRQLICESSTEIAAFVDCAIENRDKFGMDGRRFARQFSVEKFESDWQNLVARLAAE
jgi:glycosyltransferase involved in cell wall biosynthesis